MKKILLTCTLIIAAAIGMNAQIIKSGNILANETWTSNNIYLLSGWVYIKAGVTVTIQPGTVIKGDFATQGALIVERDAKLIADGTVDQPIVFTSQKSVGQRSYGDWGGVIICGRASLNQPANVSLGTQQGEAVIEGGVGSIYGGGPTPNDQDSSGILRYVRIEFPGIAFQPNSEINGLTCGGVGSKTVIEHVQVSYSGDDSFEFFGGAVNCKWLIAYRGWDDDFDTDFGYHGKIQFALSMRDPNIADASGSNGFESDNDATGTGNTPITNPIFSNVSIYGAYCFNSVINNNYKRALHLRRNTRTSAFNSVFAGYPTGLLIESSSTQTNATNGDLRFKNCRVVQMNDSLAATTAANPNEVNGAFNIQTFFNTAGFNNQLIGSTSALMVNNLNLTSPDLTLNAASPLMTGASFTDSYVNDPWFTQTTYIGAFGTTDWTDCWASWDPQNEAYTGATNNAFTVTATAAGATTFCQGSSVTLDAGSYPGATFLWSDGATTQTTNVTASGSYSVTVWKSNGCVSTSNAITVSVNPTPTAPTISNSGTTTFCNGGSVTLTSSQPTGIQWSNSAITPSINVNSSGSYDVTYTDLNGCTATSLPTVVTVNPNPSAPTISASGPTTFCTGDSVVLTSDQTTGNMWSPNMETTQSITVMNSGTYSVTYTDGNGCSATSSSTTVSSSAAPAPTVQVTGATALCPGETVTLTASASDTYLWSPGGQTTQSIVVSTTGTYFCTVTNADPCNGTGASTPVVVTALAAPTAAFSYSWTNTIVDFNNTSAGGTVYAWDFGDLSSSSAQNPSHLFTPGTYTVTLVVTNASGCSDTTTSVVQFAVGVEEQSEFSSMTLYPNPANETLNMSINLNAGTDVSVVAYDMSGKVMVNENHDMAAGQNNLLYNVSEWSNGIYFFQVTTGDVINTVRVVIAK